MEPKTLKKVLDLVNKEPRNLKVIEAALSENSISKEELMRIAISASHVYEDVDGCEEYYSETSRSIGDDEFIDENGRYYKVSKSYDQRYMDEIN